MNRPTQLNSVLRYRPARPVRDSFYKAFIRRLPCCVCCRDYRSEAAHYGPRGLGQKACDLSCIPLCPVHHRRGKDSLHKLGPVKFREKHRIDIEAVQKRLQEFYAEYLKGSAA